MLRRSCEVIWLGRAVLGEGGWQENMGRLAMVKWWFYQEKMGSLTMEHLFLSGEND